MTENKWIDLWHSSEYQKIKEKNFKIVDEYISFKPKTILDIGCGLAFESEMFFKKYSSKLFLLDDDYEITKDNNRDIEFGNIQTFKFYSNSNFLKNSFDQRKLNYQFVNASNVNIDKNISFDLIYSFLSCGFHYPANTYLDLFKKYKDAIILLDIRKETFEEQISQFKYSNIIFEDKKYFKVHLKI